MAKWIKPATAVFLLFYMIVQMLSFRVHENEPPGKIDRVIVFLAAPAQKIMWGGVNGLVNLWQHYIFLIETAHTNEQLIKEREQLFQKVAQQKEIEQENHRLRDLLGLADKEDLDLLTAERITMTGGSPYEHMIRVKRGSKDGVLRGQAVIHPLGVVGQVIKVEEHSADILLLADPYSAVDGLSQRSRARGIVKGGGFHEVKFDYLSPKDDVQVGDEVVTSGLDGVYPKGIPIGVVTKVEALGKALYTAAHMKPAVDFGRLEEVMIVLGTEK